MRKWMRERIQRRKKDSPKDEKAEGEKAAPLQPAYFDSPSTAAPVTPLASENAESTAKRDNPPLEVQSETHPPVETARSSHRAATDDPEEIGLGNAESQSHRAATGGAESTNPSAPGRRRRRGRGGRGRSSGQRTSGQNASAITERAGEGSATPAPEASAKAVRVESTAAPRASKGAVILAIGLPGSGKSSWFKRHNITPLSSDMLRAVLFDDPTEQRFQDLIFSNLRSMLKARLIARRPLNYVDATNLTPHERSSWIKLGKDYGYEVQAVFFDVPLEVCLQRNQKRERVVAEDVMRRMAAKLKAPGFDEGFSKITVVKVKQKE